MDANQAEVGVLEAEIAALKLVWEELLASAEDTAGVQYVRVLRLYGSAESLPGVPDHPADLSEGRNVGGKANL